MCVIRNAGELATRMNEGRGAEVRVGNMASFSHTFANFEFRVFPNILVKVQHSLQVLVPACYSTILDHMKIWRQSIKAFANHTFDEFRALDEESKVNIFLYFHILTILIFAGIYCRLGKRRNEYSRHFVSVLALLSQ